MNATLSIITAFLLSISLLSGCSDDDSASFYYMRFTIGTTQYEWNRGFTEVENGVASGQYATGGEFVVAANPVSRATNATGLPDNTLKLLIIPVAFSEPGTYHGGGMVMSDFILNQEYHVQYTNSVVITVSNAEAFGGVLSGTFSGVYSNTNTRSLVTLENGSFQVINVNTNLYRF